MKLFIIGNGFDLNHGYKTGYNDFKKYLGSHSYPVYDFELSHYFNGLSDDLWTDFENQLENIDFVEEMDYFVDDINLDLSDRDFERTMSRNSSIQESFYEGLEIFQPALCTAVSDFVAEATKKCVSEKEYFKNLFTDGDIFVNFNYTDLLENLYGVDKSKINHIHGVAHLSYPDKDDVDIHYGEPSIIFGHGNLHKRPKINKKYVENPFKPNECLKALNQKLKKAYKLDELEAFVKPYVAKIDTLEIIGHALGKVDELYFKVLNRILPKSTKIAYWVYDIDSENEKLKILKRLFSKHSIELKNYS